MRSLISERLLTPVNPCTTDTLVSSSVKIVGLARFITVWYSQGQVIPAPFAFFNSWLIFATCSALIEQDE